jgi:hypothetical protein
MKEELTSAIMLASCRRCEDYEGDIKHCGSSMRSHVGRQGSEKDESTSLTGTASRAVELQMPPSGDEGLTCSPQKVRRMSDDGWRSDALRPSLFAAVASVAPLIAFLAWSGASPDQSEGSKRTRLGSRIDAVLRHSLCKPVVQASLVVALLPALGTAMPLELATVSTSTTAASMGLTMLGSVAWYGVSGTIAWYGLDVIEVAKNGVEELIIEGVEGARIVVQCFWWGALILAAMTIVYVGRAFLGFVSE